MEFLDRSAELVGVEVPSEAGQGNLDLLVHSWTCIHELPKKPSETLQMTNSKCYW